MFLWGYQIDSLFYSKEKLDEEALIENIKK
jgi:hypothetical protein